MWIAFAHIIIAGLVMFGFNYVDEYTQQKEAIFISIGIGVIVLIIYVGPLGILTAIFGAAIGYGINKKT